MGKWTMDRVSKSDFKVLFSTFCTNFRLERKFLIPIMAVFIFGVSAAAMQDAEASHFRFGHLNWESTGNGNEVELSGEQAWRRTFFGSPGVGDVVGGTTTLNFGDGGFQTICILVTAIDTVDDWFFGMIVDCSTPPNSHLNPNQIVKITHTYATPNDGGVPWEAFWDSGNRIGFPLINSPNSGFRVEAEVNLVNSNTQSPKSVIPPIVDCPAGTLCQFVIPAVDVDGDDLEFSLSPLADSRINSQPAGVSIDPNSGVVSWNTPAATIGDLYAVQFAINEIQNPKIGRVVVDFFMRVASTANTPPAFVDPTPATGTTFKIPANEPFSFDLKCTDPEATTTTIMGLSLPVGSTLTPAIPSGIPATGTFSWTPTQLGVTAMVFTCRDAGLASAPPVSITIEVALLGCETFASVGVGFPGNNPVDIQGSIGKVGPTINGIDIIGNPTMDDYGMPGLAFDNDVNLFGATATGLEPGMLLKIDRTTGALIQDIGIFTEDPEGKNIQHQIADLTVSPDNQMYGLKRDPANGNLYKINTETAELEFAGNVTSDGERIRGLTFLKDGRLVASKTFPTTEIIQILLDANGDVTGTQKLSDVDRVYNGLGACLDGTLMATHIVGSHEIYVINPDTGDQLLIGAGDFDLSDLDFPVFAEIPPEPSGTSGSSGHEPPTIGKSLDGVRQVVNGGMAIDDQTWTVTQGYHQEFELLQMLTSPHTISNVIHCAKGVQYCNYIAVGFMGLTDDFNNPVMTVSASKDHLGDWTLDVYDPDDYVSDPSDTNPGVITFVPQIIDNKLLGTSFTIDFKNKDTGQLKMGIQVRDSYNGVRNFFFNEGVQFIDADAYPSVETAYESPVEVEPLCFGQNNPDRYSCQFAKMKDWATQNAEETLRQMMGNQYEYDQ